MATIVEDHFRLVETTQQVREAMVAGAEGVCNFCERFKTSSPSAMEWHVTNKHYPSAWEVWGAYVRVEKGRARLMADPRQKRKAYTMQTLEDGSRSYQCSVCAQNFRYKVQAEDCRKLHEEHFNKAHLCQFCNRYDDEHQTDEYSKSYCLGFTTNKQYAVSKKITFIAHRFGLEQKHEFAGGELVSVQFFKSGQYVGPWHWRHQIETDVDLLYSYAKSVMRDGADANRKGAWFHLTQNVKGEEILEWREVA